MLVGRRRDAARDDPLNSGARGRDLDWPYV
ncbi:unnamed protein product [Anisakis simplex]|uniref:Protein of unassigned function n=1 Tax=Anisakis simplex TaxID=6269 RepID=A0A0M3J0N9_ANISI|nr:unnamed protein product [Anisakis simplex]